jgi:hypothetical protein
MCGAHVHCRRHARVTKPRKFANLANPALRAGINPRLCMPTVLAAKSQTILAASNAMMIAVDVGDVAQGKTR